MRLDHLLSKDRLKPKLEVDLNSYLIFKVQEWTLKGEKREEEEPMGV